MIHTISISLLELSLQLTHSATSAHLTAADYGSIQEVVIDIIIIQEYNISFKQTSDLHVYEQKCNYNGIK